MSRTAPRARVPAPRTGSPTPAIRVVTPDDVPALRRLSAATSHRSLHARFFVATAAIPEVVLERLAERDPTVRAAVAGWVDGEAIGWAEYDAWPQAPGVADLAVLVTDAWQARGVGPRLVRSLVPIAVAHGFHAFTAMTQSDNIHAPRVLRRMWPDALPALHCDVMEWRLSLDRIVVAPPTLGPPVPS